MSFWKKLFGVRQSLEDAILKMELSQQAVTSEIRDAIEREDLDKVKELLPRIADFVFYTIDEFGSTFLHQAASDGCKDLAELLLANKADINAKAKNGERPLHYAAWANQKDVAKLLLVNKAKVNAKDNYGDTPLHKAAACNLAEMAELLLANKADVNAKAKNGNMPLHEAVNRGYTEVAELLLARGAKVNAKDDQGDTPLHYAASRVANGSNSHRDMVDLLRQHGGK